MKIKLTLIVIFCLFFTFFHSSTKADAYIIERSRINFGSLIYISGGCVMAYDTKLITNVIGSNICISEEGQLGKYRIYADPHTEIAITVKSHNDNGSGIIYVPDGEVTNDIESKLIIADTGITINSETSGIIDINLGGRIRINGILNSNNTYSENFSIEFNEI
ncbi:hypothetical protein Q4503_02780 [Colwellia sp. 6_MG-2023]|uniref:hypothetical protein n=1 Tax=Colwellia sp. 6_MG-2023 TaxID=3062676 RepID=UPI0026E27A55|nr:hypothetical protein [Colwellia sp. 6_MG-2023]MDO6486608.1 hypothetical protein [Colwellia sp. 6_MG-2023]